MLLLIPGLNQSGRLMAGVGVGGVWGCPLLPIRSYNLKANGILKETPKLDKGERLVAENEDLGN